MGRSAGTRGSVSARAPVPASGVEAACRQPTTCPPPYLKTPKGPKGGSHPRNIPAVLREGGGQLCRGGWRARGNHAAAAVRVGGTSASRSLTDSGTDRMDCMDAMN